MDFVGGNTLARRNGHGQALPFLSGTADAGFNTGMLISYLDEMLSHQQRKSVNTRHDEWGDCLDLAVHYLVKTGWFDQAPTNRLANVANRLAKFAWRPAALEGIAWLAAGLDTQAVRDLPAMEFAHYANACSKNTGSTRCCAAVVALCQRLVDDPPLLDSLDSVNTCLVLNAASKWPKQRVCHEAALSILERIEADDAFRGELLANAQSLSTVLNAASKWPRDATCARVASSLAQDIADDGAVRDRVMNDRFQITLSALAAWKEDEACREAVLALARRMTPAAVSAHKLDWSGWQQALHAMSGWPNEPACQAAAQVLAKRLVDHPGLPAIAPSDAALALAYLGKWSVDPTCAQAASKLAKKFGTGPDISSDLIEPNLVGALNGLSQWPDDPPCWRAGHRLAWRIHHDTAMVGEMNEQSVSVALMALARWPDDEPCRLAKHRLAARIASDRALVDKMTHAGVCTSLVALGAWPDDPTCPTISNSLPRRS